MLTGRQCGAGDLTRGDGSVVVGDGRTRPLEWCTPPHPNGHSQ